MSDLAKELVIYHRESAARLNSDKSATYQSQVDAHNKTADTIEQLQQRVGELDRIKSEWEQVAQPAFDYVGHAGIGELGKSKICALVESHKALAAHVECLNAAFAKFEKRHEEIEYDENIGVFFEGEDFDNFIDAFVKTPQTSLAEVKAVSAFDAIQKCNYEKAIAVMIDDKPVSVVKCKDMAAFAYERANKIRNGESQ